MTKKKKRGGKSNDLLKINLPFNQNEERGYIRGKSIF